MLKTKGKRLRVFRGDRPLWIIVGVLCLVSILVVYSSTVSMAYKNAGGDTSVYAIRQLRFLIIGVIVAIVVHYMEPKFYLRWSKYILIISIILAFLAYTPIFGATINGASRWFRFPGTSLTLLPSDPLKLALVMYLAVRLGNRQATISRMKLLPSLLPGSWKYNRYRNLDIFYGATYPIVVPIVLAAGVVLFANLSTAVIIVFISLVMLFVARVRVGEVIKLASVALVLLMVIMSVMSLMGIGRAETWVNRLKSYIAPVVNVVSTEEHRIDRSEMEDQFQKTQAKIAVAMGGFLGQGPGNSTQRSQLPHPYSDFAYAFIIEEYGLLGGLIILILYLWILYRVGVVVRMSQNPTHSLLVVGLSLVIVTPAFVNMAVSVGLFPVTGQPLPLISLGGTSVLFTSIAFGVILGVSRVAKIEYEHRRGLEQMAVSGVVEEEFDQNYVDSYDESYQQEFDGSTSQFEFFKRTNQHRPTVPMPAPKPRKIVPEQQDEEFIVRDLSQQEDDLESNEREVFYLEED